MYATVVVVDASATWPSEPLESGDRRFSFSPVVFSAGQVWASSQSGVRAYTAR